MTDGVFLDTVGILALLNRQDQWHGHATLAFQALTARKARLASTPYVLLESGNAAARFPAFRAAVDGLRRELMASGDVLLPTEEEAAEAWAAFVRGDAGQAGIVDHFSFAVMRREGLTRAFSNDRHFSAAGFETLF